MKTILYVEERTVGNELAGEPAESWRRIWREWFSVEPLSGREYMQAQQMQSNVSHKLRCAYPIGKAFDSRMRLTEGDDKNNPRRTFNVQSVVDVGNDHRELQWMVEEAV